MNTVPPSPQCGWKRRKGARGRGALKKEKLPIVGMLQGGGEGVIARLENVQQKTLRPILKKYGTKGTTAYTEEYAIDS